jgi:hypothetical protein
MTNSAVAALGVAATFYLSATGAGIAAEPCGKFSLKGGEKAIEVIDNPPKGPSLGDVRAGNRHLLDENGKRVADVNFSATLTALPTANTGSVFSSIYFIRFDDGWVSFTSVYELSDATDTSQRAADAIMLVSAGTGAYDNAKGKVRIIGGDPPTYEFDLSCE